MASITPQELKTLSRYIYSIAGIFLDESKGYLVESRLNPILVAFHLTSFSELYYQAKTDPSKELEKHIIDAISTNETFFFRDNTPFDLLKFKIIPEIIDQKKKKHPHGKTPLSIWSAACSTGQEVYSIAMSLMEVLPNPAAYEITIFGSDISQQAITQASYGKYNKLEVDRGLPPEYLHKYFQATADGWRIKDFIRSLASFQVMNLMQDFGPIGLFDIVFCRNIAIYFSTPDKKKLFNRITGVLRPRGYLIVGGSETLTGLAPQFTSRHYLGGIYYQLKEDKAGLQVGTDSQHKGTQPASPSRVSPPGQKAPLQRERKSELRKTTSAVQARNQSTPLQTRAAGLGQKRQPPPSTAVTASQPPTSQTLQTPAQKPAKDQKRGLLSSLQGQRTDSKAHSPGGNQTSDRRPKGSLLSRLQRQQSKKGQK
jgi:chemotaxis protein methyltransferase CheR